MENKLIIAGEWKLSGDDVGDSRPHIPCPGRGHRHLSGLRKGAGGLPEEAPLEVFSPSCPKSREAEKRRRKEAGKKLGVRRWERERVGLEQGGARS